MDSKQEEESEEGEMEWNWSLFNLDLCSIIRPDLQSLFIPSNDNENANDSIYLDADEQKKIETKKKMKENANIILSNNYAKIFILYPSHNTLIAIDSIQITNYLYSFVVKNHALPERGLIPPNTMYRVHKNIKVQSICYHT